MTHASRQRLEKARTELEVHLGEQHQITPFSTYIKEIVFGANDGIVTTFAVVAGFAGAQSSQGIPAVPYITVLLFGLANLFADAASMGLGEFLSKKSSQEMYRMEKKRELDEIQKNPASEKVETENILLLRGFSEKQAKQLVDIYAQNEKYWLDFMMDKELSMPDIEEENPLFTALATFLSFIVFGSIPLVPYFFWHEYPHVFFLSLSATFIALLLVGLMRWSVTRLSIFRSVGETVLVGGAAALLAYFVGTFFRMNAN